MINKEYSKQALDYIISLAPLVIRGWRSSSPYINRDPYFTFKPEISNEFEGVHSFDDISDCLEVFKRNICKYVGDSKRIIIRTEPEISEIEDNKFTVYCRLVADNGDKELKSYEAY